MISLSDSVAATTLSPTEVVNRVHATFTLVNGILAGAFCIPIKLFGFGNNAACMGLDGASQPQKANATTSASNSNPQIPKKLF